MGRPVHFSGCLLCGMPDLVLGPGDSTMTELQPPPLETHSRIITAQCTSRGQCKVITHTLCRSELDINLEQVSKPQK